MRWRLLEGMPDDAIRDVLALARRRTFARNEVVFHQHDPADSLHLVTKGKFAIRSMTPVGDVVTIAIRVPGDSFGEMALVGDDARRSATVVAIESAETFSVYRDDFASMRRRHRAVDDALVRFLAAEVRTLNARLIDALYVPVEKRVLRRLAELSELYTPTDGVVEIPLTQDAIAELAGATRPTVNQVLREEERRGGLELLRGKIRVIDPDALRARAG